MRRQNRWGLNANYDISEKVQAIVQTRYANDFSVTAGGAPGFSILDPRVGVIINDVINNDWLNMNIQPMYQVPVSSGASDDGSLGAAMLSQNWTFKAKDPRWFLMVSTFINARAYTSAAGKSTTEFWALPFVGYQIAPKWQLLAWGWFDANHVGGSDSFMDVQADDYVRLGVNYSVLSNFQIYPCMQVFTDRPSLPNTTIGLEFAAQF